MSSSRRPSKVAVRAPLAAETRQTCLADEGQAHRVEHMQRGELALRVPPLGGDARKTLDLGRIDGRKLRGLRGRTKRTSSLEGRLCAAAMPAIAGRFGKQKRR
jgi:hypothetical protein